MKIHVTSLTDAGKKRLVNQDSILIKVGENETGEFALLAIADGMGGFASGEVASSLTINHLERWWNERLPILIINSKEVLVDCETELNDLFATINQDLLLYADTIQDRVGTTLSVLLIYNKEYRVLHVGDSRVYQFNRKGFSKSHLTRITSDDSYIQEQMDQGLLSEEEAKNHPKKNILTNCLGRQAFDKPQIYQGKIHYKIRFLLCSDGAYNYIDEKQLIKSLFQIRQSFENSASQMSKIQKEINHLDSPDNFSLIYTNIEIKIIDQIKRKMRGEI